ncbi:MAG: hypothetical protein ACKPGB_00320, partial [Dolichospermum sp.]
KKLYNQEIIQAAINTKAGGLSSLKLYGMVGIPGEAAEDVDATVKMMEDVKKAAPGLRLTLGNCSCPRRSVVGPYVNVASFKPRSVARNNNKSVKPCDGRALRAKLGHLLIGH